MDARKHRYSTAARKPPQAWMKIHRLWGRCWCSRPKESFESRRHKHCSELHAQIWYNHVRRSWHAVRRKVLERESGTCQTCGRCRTDMVLDIDHTVPRSIGEDEWHQGNLQALCRACHEAKSMRGSQAFLARCRSYGTHSITEWFEYKGTAV